MKNITCMGISANALISSNGAMAIAFTVFVMLTVLLAAFVILLFAFKPFRQFLFRKDYEQQKPLETESSEPVQDAAVESVETVVETSVVTPEPIAVAETHERNRVQTIARTRSRTERNDRSLSDNGSMSIPTVPLEPVNETERVSVVNDIAEKRRRSGNTLDDIRTVEIPQTTPLTTPRRPEQGRFVTTTPRARRGDGAEITHTRTAPPRASVTRTRSRDGKTGGGTDDKN